MYKASYKEQILIIQGTNLYVRTYGKGENILLIHGAGTDSDFFTESASYLSSAYQVTVYDRPGYGRSQGDTPEQTALDWQVEAAANIIRRTGTTCFVAAHSAGTIIAMELCRNHPMLLKGVLLFEPPIHAAIAKEDPATHELAAVHSLLQEQKYARALHHFLPLIGEQDEHSRPLSEEETKRLDRNSYTFIQYEFETYDAYDPVSAGLDFYPLFIGTGVKSRGTFREAEAQYLSQHLQAPLLYFPGGHNSPYEFPREFACMTAGLLKTSL